jgi:hypothetical protein
MLAWKMTYFKEKDQATKENAQYNPTPVLKK